MTRKRLGRQIACVLGSLLAVSCDSASERPIEPEVDLAQAVTNGLLRPDGTIKVADPHVQGQATITEEKAQQLALTFVRQFGHHLKSVWERALDRPIDLAALEVADRIAFAESAYEPMDPSVPLPMRKAYGPYYLVTLTLDDVSVLSVAVSALATDFYVSDGKIGSSSIYKGNEFRAFPVASGTEVPLRAERAVRLVREATGKRTVRPPRLIAPKIPGLAPQGSRWELELEGPVRVRIADGREFNANRLFVDHRGHLQVDAGTASRTREVRVTTGPSAGKVITIRDRFDVPGRLERIETILSTS